MNRLDFEIIKNVIQDNSRVLDVGCETGELLKFLNKGKKNWWARFRNKSKKC